MRTAYYTMIPYVQSLSVRLAPLQSFARTSRCSRSSSFSSCSATRRNYAQTFVVNTSSGRLNGADY